MHYSAGPSQPSRLTRLETAQQYVTAATQYHTETVTLQERLSAFLAAVGRQWCMAGGP